MMAMIRYIKSTIIVNESEMRLERESRSFYLSIDDCIIPLIYLFNRKFPKSNIPNGS